MNFQNWILCNVQVDLRARNIDVMARNLDQRDLNSTRSCSYFAKCLTLTLPDVKPLVCIDCRV